MSKPVISDVTRILDVAQSLLEENGVNFTMDQLESKSAISRSTIYRKVGKKAALLQLLEEERGVVFDNASLRNRIIKAARLVFGKEGIKGSTMEQIAAEAGVGVASIYRYFGDKDTLVKHLIEEITPRKTLLAITLNPSEKVAEDLNAFVISTMRFFYENRDVLRLVFMGGNSERRYLGNLREGSDNALSHLTTYFQIQIDKGRLQIDARANELALALLGMMHSFSVIGPLHYGTSLPHPEASGALLVKIFLNNIQGE